MRLEAGKKTVGPDWTPATAFRRAVEIHREEGLYALWKKFLGEFGYRRLLYLERLLAEPSPDIQAALTLQISCLQAGDVDDYMAFHNEDPRKQIEHRLSRGDVCFVARADGVIVCASWASEGRNLSEHWIRYVGYALPIAGDEVYLYDSYTSPDYRGLDIAPCLAAWVLDYYRERGYRRTTTAIAPDNRANLRSRAKTGYRVCGSLGYLRTGPWIRHFHRGLSSPPPAECPTSAEALNESLNTSLYDEWSDWGDDTMLRDLVDECIVAQREACEEWLATYRPEMDRARREVSSNALDELLSKDLDVHGVSTDRDITNALPLNAAHIENTVLDRRVAALRHNLDRQVRHLLEARLGRRLQLINSGQFWYPPGSFMGWHTNQRAPGWRLYVTVASSPGKSFFRYRNPESGAIETSWDRGFDVRLFRVGDKQPLWHSVYSETDRFSFGFLIRPWSLGVALRQPWYQLRRRLPFFRRR